MSMNISVDQKEMEFTYDCFLGTCGNEREVALALQRVCFVRQKELIHGYISWIGVIRGGRFEI